MYTCMCTALSNGVTRLGPEAHQLLVQQIEKLLDLRARELVRAVERGRAAVDRDFGWNVQSVLRYALAHADRAARSVRRAVEGAIVKGAHVAYENGCGGLPLEQVPASGGMQPALHAAQRGDESNTHRNYMPRRHGRYQAPMAPGPGKCAYVYAILQDCATARLSGSLQLHYQDARAKQAQATTITGK